MRTRFQPERYRLLFYLAAFWNISAALVALAAPEYHAQTLFGTADSVGDPVSAVDTQIFWVSVLFFGVGYWLVARDPSKNHGLVFIAAWGKAFVSVRWIWAYSQGVMTSFVLVGAVGDLVFAALFALFLMRARADRVHPVAG